MWVYLRFHVGNWKIISGLDSVNRLKKLKTLNVCMADNLLQFTINGRNIKLLTETLRMDITIWNIGDSS